MLELGPPDLMKRFQTLLKSLFPAVSRGKSGKRGFSIVTVLLSLTLLATILAGFAGVVQNRTLRIAREVQGARAERAAEAGVAIAVARLAGHVAMDAEIAARSPVNGTPFTCSLDGETVLVIAMQDVAGRIDLNTAPDALLEALLADQTGEENAAKIVSSILARRRTNAFRLVEELAQLPGVSTALYDALRPDITVNSRLSTLHKGSARPALRTRISQAGLAEGTVYSADATRRLFEISVLVRSAPGRGYLVETTARMRPGSNPPHDIQKWNGHLVRNATTPRTYADWMNVLAEQESPSCTNS
ncbi:type II secretion system protein GspK [Breoghania sp.]|uniref:type II secretion system protein GspK n=1 Tax=Breoghania sp. TaxID=2065378 RepID=UPI002AA816A9|nr:type II secretion system protein GspK [Breoghania sp.]